MVPGLTERVVPLVGAGQMVREASKGKSRHGEVIKGT